MLSFSFPFVFLSYFLISILLDFSTCLISQNIECLINIPLKTALRQFFQGGSPWATLIFNRMFVVGVLYCVQFFLKRFCFPKSFSLFLCYSFCLLLSSILLASSPWFLWCFYGISIKFLWEFCGISMVILKRCLWYFYGIPMGFQKDVCGISMVCLWDFSGVSMIFLWDSYDIEFLWDY